MVRLRRALNRGTAAVSLDELSLLMFEGRFGARARGRSLRSLRARRDQLIYAVSNDQTSTPDPDRTETLLG